MQMDITVDNYGKELQEKEPLLLDLTVNDGDIHQFAAGYIPSHWHKELEIFDNLADTSIAGHLLGDNALAQIGATAALYGLITNTAFGLNNGLALTVSRYFGAADWRRMTLRPKELPVLA